MVEVTSPFLSQLPHLSNEGANTIKAPESMARDAYCEVPGRSNAPDMVGVRELIPVYPLPRADNGVL